MARACAAFLSVVALAASCGTMPRGLPDDRLVVFGPSLASLMVAGGMSGAVVGADRYSLESVPGLQASDVGGYLDPSFETIASLHPTSIHSSGYSRRLSELSAALGVPYHAYRFDRLPEIFGAMDSLSDRYGCSFDSLRADYDSTMDSIRAVLRRPVSISIVVFSEPGGSSLTLAGRETFLGDIVEEMGMVLLAPGTGTYPAVSVEGMLSLSPDFIFFACPGQAHDSVAMVRAERLYWAALGYDSLRVDCGFGEDLLVPGARIADTARRIASCIRWN